MLKLRLVLRIRKLYPGHQINRKGTYSPLKPLKPGGISQLQRNNLYIECIGNHDMAILCNQI
jgi:hypothetical protein